MTAAADFVFAWQQLVTPTTGAPAAQQNPDIPAAQAHMAHARATLGITNELTMTLTVSDNELSRRVAEYLQQQLKTHLNITVMIDPQTTQILVDKWRQGASDMTFTSWPVDIEDPMDQISFMGDPDFRRIFKGLYGVEDMAKLYLKNRNTFEESARLDAITDVNTLMTDKVTVLPLFESYGAVTMNPALKGFVWQPVRGYADYRAARLINLTPDAEKVEKDEDQVMGSE
jgi:ABC-type oligopeptide transport system substrate-binding subunit